MEKLKELLANECSFRPSGKLLDELLAPAESIELKKNEVLIMSGRLDPNVYIVKSGVMRYSYMNGIREVTFAFALPGSVMIAMHSYYAHLVSSSHEFAQWALRYAQGQLFYLEKKDSVINGNAKERFISLIHKRPEIIEKVALKHIASYLGITQPYLSLLKKQLKNI